MRKLTLLLVLLFLVLPMIGCAQDASSGTAPNQVRVVRRLKIRHASPALIMLLLAGRTTPLTPPEPPK